MQLQSYGGVIRVFPAWPKGWQSEFTLAAERGFLVSSRISTNGENPTRNKVRKALAEQTQTKKKK
jgi:hypothetical protein